MNGFLFVGFIRSVIAAVAGHYAALAHEVKPAALSSAILDSEIGYVTPIAPFTPSPPPEPSGLATDDNYRGSAERTDTSEMPEAQMIVRLAETALPVRL